MSYITHSCLRYLSVNHRSLVNKKLFYGENWYSGIRLAICMSSPQGYQRLNQHPQLYEFNNAIYDEGSSMTFNHFQLDQGLLLAKDLYIQHVQGSSGYSNWYGWDSKRRALVLRKAESTRSPLLSSLSVFEHYDLRSKRYYTEDPCPNETATSSRSCRIKIEGTLQLKTQPPLLGAAYDTLVGVMLSSDLITLKEQTRTIIGTKKKLPTSK